MHTDINSCAQTHTYVNIHICTQIRAHVFACIYSHMFIYMHTHTHIYVHAHIYLYKYPLGRELSKDSLLDSTSHFWTISSLKKSVFWGKVSKRDSKSRRQNPVPVLSGYVKQVNLGISKEMRITKYHKHHKFVQFLFVKRNYKSTHCELHTWFKDEQICLWYSKVSLLCQHLQTRDRRTAVSWRPPCSA